MNAATRQALALAAIAAVEEGAVAGDKETGIVDFKEEKGSVVGPVQRVAIPSRHEEAAKALAIEAACMSNSREGGILVVGVNDKASGPDAFVDTYLELTWLRERIYALTVPHLSIDEIETYPIHGKRLYLINVHPGLEEIRVDGVLRGRKDGVCAELTGDDARRFVEERRNFDWSAEESGKRLSEAVPAAIEDALQMYRSTKGRGALTGIELARRLEINCDDTDDPMLTRAGALLLCETDTTPLITVLVTTTEGARSTVHEEQKGPLVLAFENAWRVINKAFPEGSLILGPYRRAVRAIPEPALREALVNAVMHRDYRHERSAVVALATGTPTTTLKVTSPGGFPTGVNGDRLLATSKRRNSHLGAAMNMLGMGEGEGVGVDAMYVEMLREGHPAPEIVEFNGDVVCQLTGGTVDVEVLTFFNDLYRADADLREDARAHIAIIELLRRPTLRAEWLTEIAQCTLGEANSLLERLLAAGAIERPLNRSFSFRLTISARTALQDRITYRMSHTFETRWEAVRAMFDYSERISASDVGIALDLKSQSAASEVLKHAKSLGLLTTEDGRERGRGVRYVLTQKGRDHRH